MMRQRDGLADTLCTDCRRVLARAGQGLACLALVLSCGDPGGPKSPGEPAAVEVLGGQAQTGVVGKQLSDALQVRVVDAAGQAVPGAVVNFRVVQGGGSVFGGSSLTNSEGIAQERWTLGTSTTEPQRLEIRWVNTETGEPVVLGTFTATALPDVAVALTKVAGDNQQAIAGAVASDSLAVLATDQHGNPVPGVTITWSTPEGSGSPNPATSVTGATGIARTSWIVGGTGPQTAHATFAGLGSAAAFSASISAAAAANLTIWDGDNRSALIESISGAAPTVLVRDAFGNPVAGVEVTFAVTSGGGSVTATTATTDAAGLAAAGYWTLGEQPGTNTLTATAPGLAGSPLTFTATGLGFLVEDIDAAAGGRHSCAVAQGGVGYCWGNNLYGRLGDGSLGNQNTTTDKPMRVAGNLTFRTIQVGSVHSCGLTTGGEAFCWGRNTEDQLGTVTSVPPTDPSYGSLSTVPVRVSGVPTFASLAVGGNHSCGLSVAGAAYCWGSNTSGQLGNGTTSERSMPVAVSGGIVFKRLGAGSAHTCGIAANDTMYCWGSNFRGRLGNGDPGTSGGSATTPQPVVGALTFISLALGDTHTCGVVTGGAAYCWGENAGGALGSPGSTTGTPRAVEGGIIFESISAGLASTCGVAASGPAYCWGRYYAESNEQARPQPVLVPRGFAWAAIASGDYAHNCGRTRNGVAYCWGDNSWGQGGFDERSRLTPGPVRLP